MKILGMVTNEKGMTCVAEELELDDPREDEILVRVIATGICHSDISVMEQLQPIPLPMVLGHEGAGVVERVGPGVTGIKSGDKVVMSYASCGTCSRCVHGHQAYCEFFGPLNLFGTRADGSLTLRRANGEPLRGSFFAQSSFATHALCNVRNAIKLPADAPLDVCAPLGCGVQTGAGTVLNVLKPHRDAAIAIFGAGAVGLSALLAARLSGCREIIAVDRVPSRLALATDFGATRVIDTTKEGSERLLGELKLDFAVETTGVQALILKAIGALSEIGTCVLLAGARPGATIPLELIHLNSGRRIIGAVEGDADPHAFIPRMYELYRTGQLPFDRMIRRYSLLEINQAIRDSVAGQSIKPVLMVAAA